MKLGWEHRAGREAMPEQWRDVWQSAQRQSREAVAAVADAGHFCYYAGKKFYYDNYVNTAAAMTYTSLLALVPLMTLGFSGLFPFAQPSAGPAV